MPSISARLSAALYTLVGMPIPPDDHIEADTRLGERGDAESIGRDARFRIEVMAAYDYVCALTGHRLLTIDAGSIVDAAHIHPFADCNNDLRNGLALCKNAIGLSMRGCGPWMKRIGSWLPRSASKNRVRMVVPSGRIMDCAADAGAAGNLAGLATFRMASAAPLCWLSGSEASLYGLVLAFSDWIHLTLPPRRFRKRT